MGVVVVLVNINPHNEICAHRTSLQSALRAERQNPGKNYNMTCDVIPRSGELYKRGSRGGPRFAVVVRISGHSHKMRRERCQASKVFLSSRVAGARPVTTYLIMRVNVRTTVAVAQSAGPRRRCFSLAWYAGRTVVHGSDVSFEDNVSYRSIHIVKVAQTPGGAICVVSLASFGPFREETGDFTYRTPTRLPRQLPRA